ncbi:MAG: hypothetical protein ACXWPM_07200, partial [Bdellovibrionota bacterium]
MPAALLILALAFHQSLGAATCSAPAWSWLDHARVTHYLPTLQRCKQTLEAPELIAIRKFRQGGHAFLLTVNPSTLQTHVVSSECSSCVPARFEDLQGTPF